MSSNGRHARPPAGPRSGRRVAWLLALVVAVFSIGVATAALLGSDEPTVSSSITPTGSPTLTTPSPTGTTSPSRLPTASASGSTSAGPTPSEAPLSDGRYFAKPAAVVTADDGSQELSFDVAEFLTGADATAAAEADGEDATSGYYIVNEDTDLSRLPFADRVDVRYFPIGSCCDPVRGDLDGWIRGLHGAENGYAGSSSWWWLRVRRGQIVTIEEQYLP